MPEQIEFRNPVSIDELEALFKLRHLAYTSDNQMKGMVNKGKSIDINPYDIKAWHFGAFQNDQAIACIRLATNYTTAHTDKVKQLIKDHNIELQDTMLNFPFQHYYPDQAWSNNFIQSLENRHIGEVGKLAIHPELNQSKDLLNDFIEAFITYCTNELNIETGFGVCSLVLERFYRKFGFFPAEGAIPFIKDDLPEGKILRFDP